MGRQSSDCDPGAIRWVGEWPLSWFYELGIDLADLAALVIVSV